MIEDPCPVHLLTLNHFHLSRKKLLGFLEGLSSKFRFGHIEVGPSPEESSLEQIRINIDGLVTVLNCLGMDSNPDVGQGTVCVEAGTVFDEVDGLLAKLTLEPRLFA